MARINPHVSAQAPITPDLLQRLLNLYALLRTPLPVDALLQAILEAAVATIAGAHAGSILVREGQHYRFRAAVGYDLDEIAAIRFRESELVSIVHPEALTEIEGFDEFKSQWSP